MKTTITMDRSGRVVLPSETRRRLNLRPGARLLLSVVAECIELTPEPQADAELRRSPTGRTVLAPTGQTVDAAAAVRSERNAQARRRSSR